MEVARLLLKAGADKDCRDDDGTTALMHASLKGYLGVADLMLKAGADKECRDNDGKTALMRVCLMNGRLDSARLAAQSWC